MEKFKDKAHSKICANCGEKFYRDKRNTWDYWGRAKFCSRSCFGCFDGKRKIQAREPIEAAFWAKVIRRSDDECWGWLGIHDKDGYPILPYAGKMHRGNRLALQIDGREIGVGLYACHRCGNSSCLNPHHIYAGTPKQNSYDKRAHGTHLDGERAHFAKITARDVKLIRADRRTNVSIARDYSLSPSNISHIKSRKTWKDVE